MELCSAHLGCRMVLGIQNTCAKAEKFINNLANAVGEGVKTMFGFRKELTSDKVFEASLSDKQRAVEKDKGWRDLIDPIRNEVSKVKEAVKEHSPSFVEVGDTSNTGQLEGNGFRFRKLPDTVEIERVVGAYPGWTGIKTDMVDVAKETREVTERIMFKDKADNYIPGLAGKSTFSDGSEYSGTRILSKDRFLRHGKGTLTTTDGRQMEGIFVNNGFSEGTIRRRDGTLIARGKWDTAGDLSRGQLFDATGTVVIREVDSEGDKARAAAIAEEQKKQREKEADAKRLIEEQKALTLFRTSLNNLNAGQLFAKADELSSNGDASKAREVLRVLLSRFPDHPLAAAAAQKMVERSSSAVGDGSTNGAPSTTSRYSSVCIRNSKKIEAIQQRQGLKMSGATNDKFMIKVNDLWAQLMQPCVGSDQKAKQFFDEARRSSQSVESYCRGVHQNWECLEWGSDGVTDEGLSVPEANRKWFNAFSAEVRKAIGDPNYSADLDSVSNTTNGANQPSGKADCDQLIAAQERDFEAVQRRRLPEGATPPLRRVMWIASERIKLIKSKCPDTSNYRLMIQKMQAAYDESDKACGQMLAGNVCPGPNSY